MPDRRRQGLLEAEILAALWSSDAPLTPEEVRAGLDENLAYTTVQTVLVRLYDKGVVERRPRGRAYAYSPVLDEKDLAAQRMRGFLDAEGDLDGVLSRFVAALDDDQAAALRRVLWAANPVIISCALPVLIVMLFGAVAPSVSRMVRPGLAVWMLSAGGLALTLCGLSALSVVVALGVGQLTPVAYLGHWSTRAIGADSPFQAWSIWTATVLLGLIAARGSRASWSHGRRLGAAWSASREAPAGLVVLADEDPYAYAIPGWPGRIVVSRGLIGGLDESGRRALLAHEQTHLMKRHDLHQFATAVSAALNPVFFGLPEALSLACERQADESAARAVGDRQAVVRAITTAVRPQLATVGLLAAGADVPLRVRALLSPPSDNTLIPAVVSTAVLILAVSAASVLWLGHDLVNVFTAARG